MATEVRMTRRLHSSVKEALKKEECPSELKEELSEYDVNDGLQRAAIPFRLVQKLWEFSKDAGEKHQSMHLHELLEGSEVYVEPLKPPQRSAELVARLERLKAEQEQREYQKMVKNVDSNIQWKSDKKSEREETSVRSTSKQVSSIFNFILSLIGTFIFGYMASQYALTIPMRVLFGIFLSVIVGIAELYFMARTEI